MIAFLLLLVGVQTSWAQLSQSQVCQNLKEHPNCIAECDPERRCSAGKTIGALTLLKIEQCLAGCSITESRRGSDKPAIPENSSRVMDAQKIQDAKKGLQAFGSMAEKACGSFAEPIAKEHESELAYLQRQVRLCLGAISDLKVRIESESDDRKNSLCDSAARAFSLAGSVERLKVCSDAFLNHIKIDQLSTSPAFIPPVKRSAPPVQKRRTGQ